MGEAFAGRTVGRKAMLWGICAQSIPDIDFIASGWLDTPASLLAHRGFTHSMFFGVFISLLMAWLANRWHRPHNISFIRWLGFFGAATLSHIFLDTFNNYGVGLLEPFDHTRISFNTLYVVDPFFSIWPGIALVMLFLLKQKNSQRRFWYTFGLGCSVLYVSYSVLNKTIIDKEVKQLFSSQGIVYTRYFTTPAPLQTWLWFVVAGTDSGYYVGYRSVFDKTHHMQLNYFPQNNPLLQLAPDKKVTEQLVQFSQQFYTLDKKADTLILNDLRFGQVIGWQNPKEAFAFHYYLQPDIDNRLVVQRGRFAKWDWAVLTSYLRRIKGQ